ncbi:MAG: alpha amylase catalytic region [uncultured bacterium]|nr:MAG: alpha amylase catalytic region [uncultured bacterium]HBG18341.1 hypothetical protein [Desulfobulbaceae bacterium]
MHSKSDRQLGRVTIRFWLAVITCTLAVGFIGSSTACKRISTVKTLVNLPEPSGRNVIVQMFNWPFVEITKVLPRLKSLGYSHVHISPPQRSNERVWQWWGRYQPIDFSVIAGPLGSEAEFLAMNQEADRQDIKIIVDVVVNHMVSVRADEIPDPDFVVFQGDNIVSEKFPQFDPGHFHRRCDIHDDINSIRACWLSGELTDLRTESDYVRQVAREYLQRLVALGVDGFRFDAAKHIEPEFFPAVLGAVPNTYSFSEIITSDPQSLPQINEMDFYDFPLAATLKSAFGLGGDLDLLKNPAVNYRALPGPKAVTFVRNHDIDRGQANDRGLVDHESQKMFGIGWNGPDSPLAEADILLSYAYILGREDGLPYIFTDMPGDSHPDKRRDAYDDPMLTSFIRFHNLCLPGQDGVARREDVLLNLPSTNAIGWQRGRDRLILINKATEPLALRDFDTTLRPGRYVEVHRGWPLDVQGDGSIHKWDVPGQTAVMFVLTP